MEVGSLEEEATTESLVPGDGLHDALRRLELAVEDVDEGDRGGERGAVSSKAGDRLYFVLRERADRQRRALRKLAEPSAQDPTALGEHADRHPYARRVIDALDDIVEVHSHAQFEIQSVVHTPAILHEDRKLRPADLRVHEGWRIRRPLGERAVEPDDIDFLTEVVAVEARVLQVEAGLENMLAHPIVLRHRQRLDHLQTANVALLTVEEVAALPLRRVDHWQRALRL